MHRYGHPQGQKLKQLKTEKCKCLFKLKGQKIINNDDWALIVIYGFRNYPLT